MRRWEERRPAVRVPVNFTARIGHRERGEPPRFDATAQVAELSTTGLRLKTQTGLVIGEFIDIAFEVTLRNRRKRLDLRFVGRVVRLISTEPPFECAVRIVDNQEARELVRQAVFLISMGATDA